MIRLRPLGSFTASTREGQGQKIAELFENVGEPNVRQLEPDRGMASARRWGPARSVNGYLMIPFRFGQTQEDEYRTVEGLHVFGGERSDQPSEAAPWHGCHLVDHHPA